MLPYRESGVGIRLLDISSLDEREIGLDLLERPACTDQVQQVLDRGVTYARPI
jgi:hypothetical protein